jgi:hypothetical protein
MSPRRLGSIFRLFPPRTRGMRRCSGSSLIHFSLRLWCERSGTVNENENRYHLSRQTENIVLSFIFALPRGGAGTLNKENATLPQTRRVREVNRLPFPAAPIS